MADDTLRDTFAKRLDPYLAIGTTARDIAPILDALIAAVRAEQTQDWQPIDTAPKDGTHVWLWWDGERRLGHWHEAVNPPSIGGRFANWLPDDRNSVSATVKPTHWMPLPDPPMGI